MYTIQVIRLVPRTSESNEAVSNSRSVCHHDSSQLLPGFAENTQWHTLKACTLDGPLAMNGHAACSTGSQMFVYGGRQGRKVLHGLYKLCTGAR